MLDGAVQARDLQSIMMGMRFRDRKDAGERLAVALKQYRGKDGIVYPLPRGGVVLGARIAEALGMPLDLVIPRKIGHPHCPEYAICAVGEHGDLVCNEEERRRVDADWLERRVREERDEARRRHQRYLGARQALDVAGSTAILVDDGIATGLTMRAAISDIRKRKPARIVVAIPVAPRETAEKLRREVDEVVTMEEPEDYLGAVGAYYNEFAQVSDEEVIAMMGSALHSSQL